MFFNGYFTLSILQAADLTDHFNYVELLQRPRYTCNCLCKQCTLRFNYFILGLKVPVFSFVSESLSYAVLWTKSTLEYILQTLNMNVSLFFACLSVFCRCCCFLSYADLLQPNEILRKLHCKRHNLTSIYTCRYRGTDYIQQKKQYNQTIKLPGEIYCLVPLFLT